MLNNESNKTKLSVCALGLGIGIAEGLYMLLFAWFAWVSGHGTAMVTEIAQIFYGYTPSFMGGIVGAIWGFVDGFIFGVLVAWIYNLALCRCKKS